MNNEFFNTDIESLGDETFKDWETLVLESLHNSTHDGLELELRYLKSYLDAATSLQTIIKNKNHPEKYPENFDNFSEACLPFIFLCKHTIELSIKFRLRDEKNECPPVHTLMTLWRKLPDSIKAVSDKKYTILLSSLDMIDCCSNEQTNNHALTYSFNRNGAENNNGLLRVNTSAILDVTEQLYKYLVLGDEL